MQIHNVRIKWAPRHIRIKGNKAVDKLVDLSAMKED